jgi:hypothetical protein
MWQGFLRAITQARCPVVQCTAILNLFLCCVLLENYTLDKCCVREGPHDVQVLDAPQLQDDFYLNLVDWSSQNVLAVGLGSCVYLWSACTSKV